MVPSKRSWMAAGAVALVLLAAAAAAWRPVIRNRVASELNRAAARWDGRAQWQSIDPGFASVSISGLRLLPADSAATPVFSAAHLDVTVDVWALLQGRRRLAALRLDSAHFFLAVDSASGRWNIQRPGRIRVDTLAADPDMEQPPDTTQRRFPELTGPARWLFDQLTGRQFPDIQVTRTSAEIRWAREDLLLEQLDLFLNRDSLEVRISGPETRLDLEGSFSDTTLRLQLLRPMKIVVPLPDAFALRAAVSGGFASIQQTGEHRYRLHGAAESIRLDSRAIALEPLEVDYAALSTDLVFGSGRLEGSTKFTLNDLTADHRFQYDDSGSLPRTTHRLVLEPADAGAYRRSLPAALLGPLAGVDFSGQLGYEVDLDLDFGALDSLKLEAATIRRDFRLLRTGIDFQRLNGSFEQPVYDGLQVQRTVVVGRQNPAYTSIGGVPQHLIDAILTNEDVSFFQHRGFSPGAFRGALADNIRTGRFKRGASTLSMQLVKNVFLTREKTIARKFQELIITWLMEESRVVSKESMLEIYLNIIEWGPDVYGIGEASAYYFNKKPAQLTLEESLFLAAVIPSPKKFHWRFKNGALRESTIRGMEFVARKMATFAFIPEERAANLQWDRFDVTGPARLVLQPAGS